MPEFNPDTMSHLNLAARQFLEVNQGQTLQYRLDPEPPHRLAGKRVRVIKAIESGRLGRKGVVKQHPPVWIRRPSAYLGLTGTHGNFLSVDLDGDDYETYFPEEWLREIGKSGFGEWFKEHGVK